MGNIDIPYLFLSADNAFLKVVKEKKEEVILRWILWNFINLLNKIY